jgi:heme exporter protein D
MDWLVWACVTGSVLGLVGLAVVQVIRRRITRHGDGSSA